MCGTFMELKMNIGIVIVLIYLIYEWVPKANLDLFINLESKQSSVGFEPWTHRLEGECSNHWAKVWSHTSLSIVPHLKMWQYTHQEGNKILYICAKYD